MEVWAAADERSCCTRCGRTDGAGYEESRGNTGSCWLLFREGGQNHRFITGHGGVRKSECHIWYVFGLQASVSSFPCQFYTLNSGSWCPTLFNYCSNFHTIDDVPLTFTTSDSSENSTMEDQSMEVEESMVVPPDLARHEVT